MYLYVYLPPWGLSSHHHHHHTPEPKTHKKTPKKRQEDPTLHVAFDEKTKETVISGMGYAATFWHMHLFIFVCMCVCMSVCVYMTMDGTTRTYQRACHY